MNSVPKVKVKINSAIAISEYLTENYQIDDPIKLQKLLFFLSLESLRKRNRLLFSEPFEAWVYGPVVPQVYYYFRRTAAGDSETTTINFIKKLEDESLKNFIDLNLPKYLKFSTLELRNLAHETTPWIIARHNYHPYKRGRRKIKTSDLRAFAHSKQFSTLWED